MIVVGTDDPSTSASTQLLIFGYIEETRHVCGIHVLDLECIVGSVCRKWQKVHSIVGIVYDPVHDVAFAPNLGRYIGYQYNPGLQFIELLHHRSYHVLAVASKDVDIIHLVPSG